MSIPPYVRKAVTSVFLASMALALTPAVAQADPVAKNKPSPSSSPSQPPQGEQRYIVKYDNDVNAEEESKSLKEKGVEVKNTLSHTMKASVVVASPEEIKSIKNSEDVATVELDYPVSINASTSLWGIDRVDQRSGRDGQYNITEEGFGVNVYVVDTGLYLAHTEFSGRVPTGWNGIPDGNGLNDCNGHGTHVAGTVAGTTYGVATKANVIPIRALECSGQGWSSTVMAGIDWAVAHHTAGQPAVMNMSIGGFISNSFEQSIQSAVNDGITVVAAAGNANQDACLTSPAKVPSAITVAATDINDAQAAWSNYGSCVDIHAPGVAVKSAYINAPTGFNTLSGTSMATPHVAGAAAIMLSRNNSLTPAQVHAAVVNNATNGAVSAIKGATPNKMLFIPAAFPSTSSSLPLAGKAVEAVDTSGSLWSYSAAGNGTLGSRFYQGPAWNDAKQILKVDWNSDGILDIVARWGNGYVTMYAGLGNNGYRTPVSIGLGGWQDYDINAVKLKKTDTYPGLVARNVATGNLYYYPNTTGGAMTAPRSQIGFGGWTPMTEISALDLDVDGNMDLLVRNPVGELKLYRTDGAGTILNEERRTVDFGWNVMDHVAVQHDFAGAGTVGIIARNGNGYLFYYPILNGKVQPSTIIGYGGWSGYNISAGAPN